MKVLSTDLGLSNGILWMEVDDRLGPCNFMTATVGSSNFEEFLSTFSTMPHDIAVAEKPLLLPHSRLSDRLQRVTQTWSRLFPLGHLILASDWKPQKAYLRRFIWEHYQEAWKVSITPHQKDALFIATWVILDREAHGENSRFAI